mmetsp:Transcript_39886/g.122813  ORF Transcript_39886/g.122813 Transcript_39886/m.122813 type:complete len:512 (+) Transcript_39886:131-1666(+)
MVRGGHLRRLRALASVPRLNHPRPLLAKTILPRRLSSAACLDHPPEDHFPPPPPQVPREPLLQGCLPDCLQDCLDSAARPPLAPHVLRPLAAHIAAGAEEPFYLVDLAAVRSRVALWRRELPRVDPFYAVKCNPDGEILSLLGSLGCGFDCASRAEMSLILEAGVSPDRIVYANPCKQPSHLRFAAAAGVRLSVFDSEAELLKTAAEAPSAELLLRIQVDDSKAVCVMSNKYGAPLAEAPSLLRRAAELGLRVRGVSFHVGSGCYSPQAYVAAVQRAAHVFSLAEAAGGRMDLLDLGGGFPGVDSAELSFSSIAAALRPALDASFPPSRGVRLLAEPGRFLAAESHTLAAAVIGKKRVADAAAEGGTRQMLYINDGLYGSFNCLLYDHASVTPEPLPASVAARAAVGDGPSPWPARPPPQPAAVWGPTCDGFDCVLPDTKLPELAVGDWVVFRHMGAYTAAAGSNFNGMALPSKVYVDPGAAQTRPAAGAAAEVAEVAEWAAHHRRAAAAM